MYFEPTTPFVLFGYFDIILLSIILLMCYLVLKFKLIRKIDWKVNLVRYTVLFFVCPYFSGEVEANSVHHKYEIVDGFNLLYIIFRWPTWWLIGIFIVSAFNAILEIREENRV
jgi:hypothetical protein